MRVRVDHTLRRQLSEAGPWIFWRATPGAAEKAGLVVETSACHNRECSCREVQLRALTTSGSLQEMDSSGAGVDLLHDELAEGAVPQHSVRALVDVDSGVVTADCDEGEVADEELLDWLRAEMDGELLEALYGVWLRAKAWRRRERFTAGPWMHEPQGTLIGFDEAFPDERQDVYVLDGRSFFALDHHCIEPGCECTDVRVAFLGLDDPGPDAEIGSVVYDLVAQRTVVDADERHVDLLTRLWNAYRARHPLPSHLALRTQRMKGVGRELRERGAAGIVARAARIGRNDPCPCGSGRKYKRCCIDALGNEAGGDVNDASTRLSKPPER